MGSKIEIANYINSCNKCFAAFLGDENSPQVFSIKFFNVEKDTLIIGLKDKDLKEFRRLLNQKIAVTMWDKIKGYQIKGVKITQQLKEYEDILNRYKNYLENKGVNYKEITFINYHIKEIFHVTPGKYAGKKIEVEV